MLTKFTTEPIDKFLNNQIAEYNKLTGVKSDPDAYLLPTQNQTEPTQHVTPATQMPLKKRGAIKNKTNSGKSTLQLVAAPASSYCTPQASAATLSFAKSTVQNAYADVSRQLNFSPQFNASLLMAKRKSLQDAFGDQWFMTAFHSIIAENAEEFAWDPTLHGRAHAAMLLLAAL